jgi:hypothetical protein
LRCSQGGERTLVERVPDRPSLVGEQHSRGGGRPDAQGCGGERRCVLRGRRQLEAVVAFGELKVDQLQHAVLGEPTKLPRSGRLAFLVEKVLAGKGYEELALGVD